MGVFVGVRARSMAREDHLIAPRMANIAVLGVVLETADDRPFVHDPGRLGQELADLNARDPGCDRLELAANLDRSVGLHVPGFKLARPAAHVKDDHRRRPFDSLSGQGSSGFGSHQARKRQPTGAQHAHLEQASPVQACVERVRAVRIHGQVLIQVHDQTGCFCLSYHNTIAHSEHFATWVMTDPHSRQGAFRIFQSKDGKLAGRLNRQKRRGLTLEGHERLRKVALTYKPWQFSTGPRTKAGKMRSAANGKFKQEGPVSLRQLKIELAGITAQVASVRDMRLNLSGKG